MNRIREIQIGDERYPSVILRSADEGVQVAIPNGSTYLNEERVGRLIDALTECLADGEIQSGERPRRLWLFRLGR